MTANYDALQKLEAVERATGLCRRVAPSMIAKGQVTQRQVSDLMNVLAEIALDYGSQVIDKKKLTPSGCPRLCATRGSDSFTRHNVD